MAEVAMIIGLIDGSAGLLIKCGSVVNTLNDITGKFKQAELAIKMMIQQVDTIKAAWTRIREWSIECQKNEDARRSGLELLERLDQSLECGDLVISALEEGLVPYRNAKKTMSLRQRSKFIWNENLLHLHRDRVRDQVLTMNLLLQVLQLPTSGHRINLLRESELKLRQYDESAFSIVPSRMSSRISVSTYRRSTNISVESVDMVYKPLSFENELFTAMVYKRNYRNPMSSSVIHNKVIATGKANQPNRMRRNSATKVEEAEVVQDTTLTQSNRVHELMAKAKPGYRPVHVVAEDGNIELMEELVAGGAVINDHTDDDLKWTPLHFAAKYGHAPMTRLLLQKGARVDSSDYRGSRPIHYACEVGSSEVVSILLDDGADINHKDKYSRQPLYRAACSREQPDMIEFLSSRGANLNGEVWGSRTPLHVACEQGYVLNIRILLALYTKAGLDLPDDTLSTAVRYAKPSAVEELLEHGLDPDIDFKGDFGGKTALHYTLFVFICPTSIRRKSSFSEHPEDLKSIVQILLKYKANVRTTDKHGNQAIRMLMRRRYRNEDIDDQYKEVFDLLLTSGADLNALDDLQRSPLWKAAAYLNYSMVSFLLSRGATHLSESQLSSLTNYYSEYPLISQADAEKMMEFLAKKAAEPICQPSFPTPDLLANATSDHEDKQT